MSKSIRKKQILRIAREYTKQAGEVRFIKDRGSDDKDWGWGNPGPSQREIDPEYQFKARNLEPLAKTLRSSLMALGHIQTAYATFTKIKSRTISPDGSLGGKGYIMAIKDMRRQLMNCSEALSAVSDTIYDELNASHWNPAVDAQDPREREEVQNIMDDVEEIRQDPEEWAEEEESEMGVQKQGSILDRTANLVEKFRSRRVK